VARKTELIDEEPYYGTAADFVPPNPTLENLREAAAGCKGCHLWRLGTQTVFGEGPRRARVMLVGEQPGDKEDLAGHPFVGPAGQMLNSALEDAGIDREEVYTTNAVKHFKWEPANGRRLHKKPNTREIKACRPWLDNEIAQVQPEIIVCLGATAAQALLGKDFRLTQHRGEFVESSLAPFVIATLHPSALLRMPDEESRRAARESFVDDLKLVSLQLSKKARLL
jgi:uracil-DNA glycosylase